MSIRADSLLEKSEDQKLAGIVPELRGGSLKQIMCPPPNGGHGRGFLEG